MSSERKADGRPRPHVEGFAGPARTPLVISGGESSSAHALTSVTRTF